MFFSKKTKEWDIPMSNANRDKIRELFNGVMSDGDSWKVAYGYNLNVKTSNYVLARKTTYEYASMIVGYRESDMSIALIETTPELDGCGEPEIFTPDSIKKAKVVAGMYTIYYQGGIMAGYRQFDVREDNDEEYLAYVYQPEEAVEFKEFFKKFSGK